MDPSTFLPLASASNPLCVRAPWDAPVWVMEVSFSNDSRLFGKMPEVVHGMLQANRHACQAASGTPNAVKLKGLCLILEAGVIWYPPGPSDSFLGRVEWNKEGLSMTGIHRVQAEAPTDKLGRMEQLPYRIVCTLRSLRPS